MAVNAGRVSCWLREFENNGKALEGSFRCAYRLSPSTISLTTRRAEANAPCMNPGRCDN